MSKDDIFKASGIILKDRRVLVERSAGKEFFIHPGGKIEPGETTAQALIRELKEELQIDVGEEDLEFFGRFSAPAANSPEVNVHMDVYYQGTERHPGGVYYGTRNITKTSGNGAN